jgi:Protein of unknown function (DUF3574)
MIFFDLPNTQPLMHFNLPFWLNDRPVLCSKSQFSSIDIGLPKIKPNRYTNPKKYCNSLLSSNGYTNLKNYCNSPLSETTQLSFQVSPSLIQQDLYFNLNRPNQPPISSIDFQDFVDRVITPRFSSGLTFFDPYRNLFDQPNTRKMNPVISLYTQDSLENKRAIAEIIHAYQQQLGSEVLQVTNADELKVSFGTQEDLIENDPIPEWIQVDLFFGRNIGEVEGISYEEFQTFVETEITSRFPNGLSTFNTKGQFLSNRGNLIREASEIVSLIMEDSQANETAIAEIVTAYTQKFHQESVLIAVNENITVAFAPMDNLIENDRIPKLIQVDLFFGQNIGEKQQVSEAQFQAFLDAIVVPNFAEFTVLDAKGQFLSSTGDLIKESSKAVSFIVEDTIANEIAINSVISTYMQQFQQESVLVVIDETITVQSTRKRSQHCSIQ